MTDDYRREAFRCAAGEAGGQVGDSIGAAHGADVGGEAVAVTDALRLRLLSHLQNPGPKHEEKSQPKLNQKTY